MNATVHAQWVFLMKPMMPGPDEELFSFCDKLMQALLAQEACGVGFSDPAVSVDVEHGSIEIEAELAGNELAEALSIGASAVRAALHEVGAGTPDWPTHDEVMSMVLKDLRTEQLV